MATLLHGQPDTSWLRAIRIEPESGIPLHVQVRAGLCRMIEQHFEDGDAFYPEAVVIENLPVSKITVGRALQDLKREGLLRRERGRGTVVLRQTPAAPEEAARSAPTLTSIGMFRTRDHSDYCDALGDEVARACLERGLDFHIRYCRDDERVADLGRQLTRGPGEEAFVSTFPPLMTIPFHEALAARGYRALALDGVPNGYAGSFVLTDSRAAVRVGLEHLCSLGHRRITLLVNEPLDDASVTDKVGEFQRAMHARGLSADGRVAVCNTHRGDNSYDAASLQMEEVWSDDPRRRPTAIFTVSDPGAWGALAWLRSQGVAVPAQVSVLGFEDARTSRFTHPALTTVAHPVAERARRAVQILLDEPAGRVLRESVAPFLVTRESTGPAPGGAPTASKVLIPPKETVK